MKQISVIATALLAGILGGAIGAWATRAGEKNPESVVRARSFELVNEAGQTISFWGVDNLQQAVLAFGSRGLTSGGSLHGRPPGGLADPENHVAVIGLQGNDMPLLKFLGPDKKTRVRLLLSPDGKPTLLMEDETGPRVLLGIEQSDTPGPEDNNWSLLFAPEMARIGMGFHKQGKETYLRGVFSVNKDSVKYPER